MREVERSLFLRFRGFVSFFASSFLTFLPLENRTKPFLFFSVLVVIPSRGDAQPCDLRLALGSTIEISLPSLDDFRPLLVSFFLYSILRHSLVSLNKKTREPVQIFLDYPITGSNCDGKIHQGTKIGIY